MNGATAVPAARIVPALSSESSLGRTAGSRHPAAKQTRLGISSKTVESHLRRLFERHGLASRTELATRAPRDGWLELPSG